MAASPHHGTLQVFEAYADVDDSKVLGLRFALLQNSLLWRIWMDQVGGGLQGPARGLHALHCQGRPDGCGYAFWSRA